MLQRKQLLALARYLGLAAFICLSVGVLVVRAEMFFLRCRLQSLVADMHRIRLYQSTWADAQALMARWGAWGHYDGTCTAEHCSYRIATGYEDGLVYRVLSSSAIQAVFQYDQYRIFEVLGWRPANIDASFVVYRGTIWRSNIRAMLEVPPNPFASNFGGYGYTLMAQTKSRSILRRTQRDFWILGGDEGALIGHPYYKIGRPGGCEGCEEATVTYSTRTPAAEIERLTTFDFSCLTRPLPCNDVADLLPAAEPFHFYDDYNDHHNDPVDTGPPEPCDLPVWAMARDHAHALVVEALAVERKSGDGGPYDLVHMLVIEPLKGDLPSPAATSLNASLYSGYLQNYPHIASERMLPGHRYIVFLEEDERDNLIAYEDGRNGVPPCGVHEDTPSIREEVRKGIAQNDVLPGPEFR